MLKSTGFSIAGIPATDGVLALVQHMFVRSKGLKVANTDTIYGAHFCLFADGTCTSGDASMHSVCVCDKPVLLR
jgi:hypothetical protein